jgi:hypothetical protein
MKTLLLLLALPTFGRAEYSDWCSDAVNYHLEIARHPLEALIGDGGRVCGEDGPGARRPVTRFSSTGGLTSVSSYYAFFEDRVRLELRHLKFRCGSSKRCQPVRAGERCAVPNAAANAWSGAENYVREAKLAELSPATRKLAFERVAWNALVGVAAAREIVADETKWESYGLDASARANFSEDLAFAKRHCAEIAAEGGGGLLAAGRVGAIEGERLVPLAEFYDDHWNVSETAFRSLYKRLDAAASEVWALRTAVPEPVETHWRQVDGSTKAMDFALELPFLLTGEDVQARRGFYRAKTELPPSRDDVRIVTSLGSAKDPEGWRPSKTIAPSLAKRARELFRTDYARSFECLPSADETEGEQMRLTADPFADRDLDVFRAFVARSGDALVGIRARNRCKVPGQTETAAPPVLQTHWYFVPKAGPARVVTRAKDARLAADFDGDGSSEWIFTSQGIDAKPPYYYALFDRKRGEVLEAH